MDHDAHRHPATLHGTAVATLRGPVQVGDEWGGAWGVVRGIGGDGEQGGTEEEAVREQLEAAALSVSGVTGARVHDDPWSRGDLLVEIAVDEPADLNSPTADAVRQAIEAVAATLDPRPSVRLGGVMGTL